MTDDLLRQLFQGLVIFLLTVIANYLRGISNAFKEVKTDVKDVQEDIAKLETAFEVGVNWRALHDGTVHPGLDRRLTYLEHGRRAVGNHRDDD